jgi:CheY-like chemotaxis protein
MHLSSTQMPGGQRFYWSRTNVSFERCWEICFSKLVFRCRPSGEEAATLLGSMPARWALVTDINPGRGKMDGWELARLARQQDPGRAILYMSGDSAHHWAAKGVPRSILLPKPFAAARLLEATSRLLGGH